MTYKGNRYLPHPTKWRWDWIFLWAVVLGFVGFLVALIIATATTPSSYETDAHFGARCHRASPTAFAEYGYNDNSKCLVIKNGHIVKIFEQKS